MFLCLGFVFFVGSTSVYAQDQDIINDLEQVDILKKSLTAITEKNWGDYPSYWDKENEAIFKEFLNNKENQAGYNGLFNIKKASLIDTKVLSVEDAQNLVPNIETFKEEKSEDILVLYSAINYDVYTENEFSMNGTNYFVTVFIKEDGQWKIAQYQIAPVDIIVSRGLGFNTGDEKKTIQIFEEKKQGNIVNKEGKLLSTNKATAEELKIEGTKGKEEFGLTTVNDHVRPTYVKVYLASTSNKFEFGCSSNCVANVGFLTYIQNTLPNEWEKTWPIESLNAGAMVVKMYAWYATYYPLAPLVNAHVYDNTNSQVFLVGTAAQKTNSAINNTGSLGLENYFDDSLFLTEYRAGVYGTEYMSSGIVRQNGTHYWADQGQDWRWILEYYYNNSERLGGFGSEVGYFGY